MDVPIKRAGHVIEFLHELGKDPVPPPHKAQLSLFGRPGDGDVGDIFFFGLLGSQLGGDADAVVFRHHLVPEGIVADHHYRGLKSGLDKQGGDELLQIGRGIQIDEMLIFAVPQIYAGAAGQGVGAQYITDLIDEKDLITVDIGGTSTDISLVVDGRFEASDEKTISGYPVRIPSIDISTIGAGGGSIGWIDSGGILKVGPQSAGANPGPACYNLGGTKATITDARVVLGHLNQETLLGGRLPIDAEKSREAVQELADKINMELLETARGIISVSNSNITKEIKNVTVAKGYNPSDFCLVAFGGSGPVSERDPEMLRRELEEGIIDENWLKEAGVIL